MFITVDPYYDNAFYNECKEALKNNGVPFEVFISIKAPYDWYFKIADEYKPIMVNYDSAGPDEARWMVNTVKPLRANEEYLLLRRNNDNGAKALLKFVENEPLLKARKAAYSVLFTVKNREELEQISKDYPGRIWYMGKYFKNRYRVCLGTHAAIKNFLTDSQILLENNKEYSEPGRFEVEFNRRVLRGNDHLIKFTETPYFEKGVFKRPKIRGEHSSRFNI
jgi:hypothetical protein